MKPKIDKDKLENIILYFFYIFGAIAIISFLSIVIIRSKQETRSNINLTKINFVVEEEGNAENDYTWTGHFDQDVDKRSLMIFMHYAKVKIFTNGEIYGTYGYNKLSIGKSAGEEWVCFAPGKFSTDDVIQIQIYNVYSQDAGDTKDLLFNNIYAGDKLSLTKYNILKNLSQIILSVIIILAGILMAIVITTLKSMEMKTPKEYKLCSALMIVGASCTLIDYDYISLIFSNTFIFTMIDDVLQIVIVELLLLFMRSYIQKRIYHDIANLFITIWTSMALAFFHLQINNYVDGIEVVNIYIVVALLMVIAEIIFMIIDYRKFKNYLAGSVIYSGIILCIFTFVELVYFFIYKQFIIMTFLVGLFLFTAIQFMVMIHYTRDGMRQTQRANELEKQLMQSRIAIMLSQIQPHFLYNSLGSISQLCMEDPAKAGIALDQFSDFLRGNMTSLSCSKPIPFSQELTHLKNYIALEKIRFGDRIRVEYDLQVEDFEIPALTLQPIVENSIKHGITKRREGGIVRIITKRSKGKIFITISDDGIGYDQKKQINDGRNHIGIQNVQTRIKEMCDGGVTINSCVGKGTTVVITIREDKK